MLGFGGMKVDRVRGREFHDRTYRGREFGLRGFWKLGEGSFQGGLLGRGKGARGRVSWSAREGNM